MAHLYVPRSGEEAVADTALKAVEAVFRPTNSLLRLYIDLSSEGENRSSEGMNLELMSTLQVS